MDDLTVDIEKTIHAPIERVFDAWLDPELLSRFMLPMAGMKHPRVTCDPRQGGDRHPGDQIRQGDEGEERHDPRRDARPTGPPAAGDVHQRRPGGRGARHASEQRRGDVVADVEGLGLLRGIHIKDPQTGELSREVARDWTWSGVKHGVMLFQVNRPSIKVCPPLVIDDDALVEGIRALGDALEDLLGK